MIRRLFQAAHDGSRREWCAHCWAALLSRRLRRLVDTARDAHVRPHSDRQRCADLRVHRAVPRVTRSRRPIRLAPSVSGPGALPHR